MIASSPLGHGGAGLLADMLLNLDAGVAVLKITCKQTRPSDGNVPEIGQRCTMHVGLLKPTTSRHTRETSPEWPHRVVAMVDKTALRVDSAYDIIPLGSKH